MRGNTSVCFVSFPKFHSGFYNLPCTSVLFITLGAHAQRALPYIVVLCVCLSVCLSHLTYEASVRPENAVTYSAGNEGQKICGDLPETTAFKSYSAKHERKSQYANYSHSPPSAFSA